MSADGRSYACCRPGEAPALATTTRSGCSDCACSAGHSNVVSGGSAVWDGLEVAAITTSVSHFWQLATYTRLHPLLTSAEAWHWSELEIQASQERIAAWLLELAPHTNKAHTCTVSCAGGSRRVRIKSGTQSNARVAPPGCAGEICTGSCRWRRPAAAPRSTARTAAALNLHRADGPSAAG